MYLDPPFNKKKTFTAPIGSSAEGASFKDIFTVNDIEQDWIRELNADNKIYAFLEGVRIMNGGKESYNYCYLVYMAMRLIECHRVLKETGSLYLHCDPTMSHYLKLLLDCIFGEKNFRNEIVWGYRTGGISKKHFARKHDVILFYIKTNKYFFDLPREESRDLKRFNRLDDAGRYFYEKAGNRYYADEGVAITDNWDIPPVRNVSKERTGYPTQKPLVLLERIIKASSNKDDVVLDPFCGCATTCVAAEKLNRQWIGIDVSVKAYDLVKERLEKEVADPEDLFKYSNIINFDTDPPKRTDMNKRNIKKSYVYIAENPDNVKLKDCFKVGISDNPEQRIKSAFDPFGSTRIIYKALKENYKETETYIHSRYRVKDEWVGGVDFNTLKKEIDEYKEGEQLGFV